MNQRSHLYFAFKIMDGLFIGDLNSLKERDFLQQNKISFVVNCSYPQLQPTLDVQMNYLNFEWLDSDEQIILDPKDDQLTQAFSFLEQASQRGESSLICSFRGQSRSLTLLTGYLMKKFEWSLYKALEYMNSKRSDFEIRASFLQQLIDYDKRLKVQLGDAYSKSWQDLQQNEQAILIQNTFFNSQLCIFKGQATNIKIIKQPSQSQHHKTVVTWNKQLLSFYGKERDTKTSSTNASIASQKRYQEKLQNIKPHYQIPSKSLDLTPNKPIKVKQYQLLIQQQKLQTQQHRAQTEDIGDKVSMIQQAQKNHETITQIRLQDQQIDFWKMRSSNRGHTPLKVANEHPNQLFGKTFLSERKHINKLQPHSNLQSDERPQKMDLTPQIKQKRSRSESIKTDDLNQLLESQILQQFPLKMNNIQAQQKIKRFQNPRQTTHAAYQNFLDSSYIIHTRQLDQSQSRVVPRSSQSSISKRQNIINIKNSIHPQRSLSQNEKIRKAYQK